VAVRIGDRLDLLALTIGQLELAAEARKESQRAARPAGAEPPAHKRRLRLIRILISSGRVKAGGSGDENAGDCAQHGMFEGEGHHSAPFKRLDAGRVTGAWTNGDKTVTPRVLVVEDEPNIRELVCLHLGIEGYACEGVGDGQHALRRAESERFDLLVVDLM